MRDSISASVALALGATLSAATIAPPAQAEQNYDNKKPLWTQVEELTCRGSHRQVCVEDVCFRKVSKAQWRINFKDKKIYMGGLGGLEGATEFAEKIIAFDHVFYGEEQGSRHVIYFSGRLMDFDMDNAADAGGHAVSARSLHYAWRKPFGFDWEDSDNSVETRFGCAPTGESVEFQPNVTFE